jgi:hypothetical protein
MASLCREAGVAAVLVREIKGAPVSGAAKWLSPRKAMIGLTLRGGRDDRFWFSFFHEARHLLHDSKKETYTEVDPRNWTTDQERRGLKMGELVECGQRFRFKGVIRTRRAEHGTRNCRQGKEKQENWGKRIAGRGMSGRTWKEGVWVIRLPEIRLPSSEYEESAGATD